MMLFSLSLIAAGLSAFSTVTAQFVPDSHWTNPDGSYADYTDSFQNGQTVSLSWKSFADSSLYSRNNYSHGDLWLSTSNSALTYSLSIATNIDISNPGSVQWTPNVDQAILEAATNKFLLHIFPPGAAYGNLQFYQYISPGFYIRANPNAPTTTAAAVTSGTAASSTPLSSSTSARTGTSLTTSTGATSSVTSSTRPLSSATSSSTTSSAKPSTSAGFVTSTTSSSTSTSASAAGATNSVSASNTPSKGLSVGAQAGLGVGIGLGVVALFILGCFFGRKYSITRRSEHPTAGISSPYMGLDDSRSPGFTPDGTLIGDRGKPPTYVEMKGDRAHPSELAGGPEKSHQQPVELEAR